MTETATLVSTRGDAQELAGLTPLTGKIGARIDGISLADCDRAMADLIRSALDKYRVLVFPKQIGLEPLSFARFSKFFGEPESVPHPNNPDHPDTAAIKVLKTNIDTYPMSDNWHADGSSRENRHWITILQAVDVPAFGRDTMFSDQVAIYEYLSEPMRAMLDNTTSTHSWGMQKPEADPVVHPTIITNPRTGARALYVNRFYTRHINGLHADESAALLEYLFNLTKIPEFQLRVRWEPGDVVMWDNEFVQHYLVFDKEYPRVMHRIMVTDA